MRCGLRPCPAVSRRRPPMPELPDLEAIQDFILAELTGVAVTEVLVLHPIPIRLPTPGEFGDRLRGQTLQGVRRRGKFLLLDFSAGDTLAVNPMLTGRFQYGATGERRKPRTCFILRLANGHDLRYFDSKLMGKRYLVEQGSEVQIPRWEEMGPEALDPEMTLEIFIRRLRRHPGQLKNILINDTFLAGIGNAYADEILFAAGLYPYQRRVSLTPQETGALYQAMVGVLTDAKAIVAARMGEQIHLKIRDFLKIHGKGGKPCPACGGTISQITANQRITNYCRRCQQ